MLKTLFKFFSKDPKNTGQNLKDAQAQQPWLEESDSRHDLITKLHSTNSSLSHLHDNSRGCKAHWHTNAMEQQYTPPHSAPNPAIEVYCRELRLKEEDKK
jgi:hypothetical protein